MLNKEKDEVKRRCKDKRRGERERKNAERSRKFNESSERACVNKRRTRSFQIVPHAQFKLIIE